MPEDIFADLLRAAKGIKRQSKSKAAAEKLVAGTKDDDGLGDTFAAAKELSGILNELHNRSVGKPNKVWGGPAADGHTTAPEEKLKPSFSALENSVTIPSHDKPDKVWGGPVADERKTAPEAKIKPSFVTLNDAPSPPAASSSAAKAPTPDQNALHLTGLFDQISEKDPGADEKDEMPPPARELVTPALEGMPKTGARPIIGTGGKTIGWAAGESRGKATMGMTEDLQEEARLGKPHGSIMREAFMPKVDDSVSGVIPEPEPTAENSYRMSARQSAKIPESVAQARERTDKEQLDWGAQQHNLALQQLQLDPKAQADAGLAPGQLGSILRGARAGDAQAVDILDILLGQGDTANENVNELRSLLKDPGLSPKDRRAIIAEINKVQSPGREHSFRGALEQKKMDAQAEALEKKQRIAQDQFEARRQDAVTNREDVQENARAMQDQRLQATMQNSLVRRAMESPVRMSDEQLEKFGATLPPDLKDQVIFQVKANQDFLAEENDRKLGAYDIDQKIKAARLDQFEAGKEQDKQEEAHRLYNMAVDAYKRGLAGGVPLSDERLGRWVDALVKPLKFESPQALIDSIKSAGAKPTPDPRNQERDMMAEANMAVKSGKARSEHYRVLYGDALLKGDPVATALQQKVAEARRALGRDLTDDLVAEMIAFHGGNIREVMADLDEDIANAASGKGK